LKKEHAKHDGLLSRTKSELEKARAAQQAKKEHESTLERILGVSSTDRCSTKVKVTLILERRLIDIPKRNWIFLLAEDPEKEDK
jgi:hypothetical protein